MLKHGITDEAFGAFLSHIDGEVVGFREKIVGDKHMVVTVAHGGEIHSYTAHDVAMLARRR